MLQQSLIGGKFFAVMFWLIADGLFAVVVVVVSWLPDCHLRQQCTTATCGTNNSCHCCAQNVAATFFMMLLLRLLLLKHWPLIVACLLCWTWCLFTLCDWSTCMRQLKEAEREGNTCMYEHIYEVQQLPHLVASNWTASVRIMRGLRVLRCPVDTNVH